MASAEPVEDESQRMTRLADAMIARIKLHEQQPDLEFLFDYVLVLRKSGALVSSKRAARRGAVRLARDDVIDRSLHRTELFASLEHAGVLLKLIPIESDDYEFYGMWCPVSSMEEVASSIGMKLRLKNGLGFLEYSRSNRNNFVEADNPDCPFQSRERQILLRCILYGTSDTEAEQVSSGLAIHYAEMGKHMASSNVIAALYPTHQVDARDDLQKKWSSSVSSLRQPFDDIKDYFGERVAFYFAWLEMLTIFLLIPALVGILHGMVMIGLDNVDIVVGPVSSVIHSIWVSVCLKWWHRRCASLGSKWSLSGVDRSRWKRPEVSTGRRPSRGTRYIVQALLVVFLCGVVAGNYFAGRYIEQFIIPAGPHYDLAAAAVIGTMAYLLNSAGFLLIRRVGDFVCFSYDEQYQKFMALVAFPYMMANYLVHLLELVFVSNLDSLAVQSGTFFVLFVIFNWLVALWRLLLLRRSTSQSAKLSGGDVKRAVVEYGLETPSDFSYALCNSLISLSFTIMFNHSFPLIGLVAVVVNVLFIRMESHRLVTYSRRPESRSANNLGTWETLFSVVALLSVVVNTLILANTSQAWAAQYLNAASDGVVKWWSFLVFEHVVFVIKFGVDFFVPDVPKRARVRQLRVVYQQRKAEEQLRLKILQQQQQEIHRRDDSSALVAL